MRIIGRLIILLLLISVLIFSGHYIYKTVYIEGDDYSNIAQKQGYIKHTAYLVNNFQTVKYVPPKNATHFKVIIYPVRSKKSLATAIENQHPTEDLEYTVNVKRNSSQKEYLMIGGFDEYKDMLTDEIIEPFITDDSSSVALSKTINLELKNDKEVTINIASDHIDAYIIRSYYQQRQSSKRVSQQWVRSSKKRKENLLKYYPLDEDNVKNYEINNLYKNAWSSIAPSGLDDVDFKVTNLLEFENRQTLVLNEANNYSKEYIYLPKQHKYTFSAIKASSLNFTFNSLSDLPSIEGQLLWKKPNGSIVNKKIKMNSFRTLTVEPGDFELSFDQDIAFRITGHDDNNSIELPESFISGYHLSAGDDISFNVITLKNLKQSFKTTVHGLGAANKARLKIEIFSENKLIQTQNLDLKLKESNYMPYLIGNNKQLTLLSEAAENVFDLPLASDKILITLIEGEITLKLSNKTAGLAAIKTISTDKINDYQNAWFALKAKEHIVFNRDKKVLRYLDIDKFAIETERKVDSFEKLSPKNSKRFKVAYYKDDTSIYSGYSALSFRKLISSNQLNKNTYIFKDKKTSFNQFLKPVLLIHAKQSGQAITQESISFNKIDLPIESSDIVQEFILPSIQANKKYNLLIPKQSKNDYYLNYTDSTDTQLVKKQFYKAKPTLRYDFYKKGGSYEGLTLHLLSSTEKAHELDLSIYKNNQLINSEKTENSRIFKYQAPDTNLSNNILRTTECAKNCYLYTPQFIPLFEDLETGWYEIRISPKQAGELYIDVTRTYYENNSRNITFTDEIE